MLVTVHGLADCVVGDLSEGRCAGETCLVAGSMVTTRPSPRFTSTRPAASCGWRTLHPAVRQDRPRLATGALAGGLACSGTNDADAASMIGLPCASYTTRAWAPPSLP